MSAEAKWDFNPNLLLSIILNLYLITIENVPEIAVSYYIFLKPEQ